MLDGPLSAAVIIAAGTHVTLQAEIAQLGER